MASCLVLTLIGFVLIQSVVKCEDQHDEYVPTPPLGFIPDQDLSNGIYTMAKEFDVLGAQLNSLHTSPGIRRGICEVGFQGITPALEITGCNTNRDLDNIHMTTVADAMQDQARPAQDTPAKLVSVDRTPVSWLVVTNININTLREHDLDTMNKVFKRLTPDSPCSVNVTLQGTFFEFYEVSRALWVHDTRATDDFRTRFIEDRVSVTGELEERDDTLALFLIFQISAFSKLAQQQGVYFTWPALSKTFCQPPYAANRDGSVNDVDIVIPRPDFEWHTGSWSQCSVPCGGGYATRDVFCSSKYGMMGPSTNCIQLLRPPSWKRCNMQPCGGCHYHQHDTL